MVLGPHPGLRATPLPQGEGIFETPTGALALYKVELFEVAVDDGYSV